MRIPGPIRAVLDSLQFQDPRPEALSSLTEEEWRRVLEFCDRNQLTLLLLTCARGRLPAAVEERLTENTAANARRVSNLLAAYREADEVLRRAGVPFLVLKGFSQCPWFTHDPARRPQYDIDLYCPGDHALTAMHELLSLGYKPLRGYERHPTDHLPTLVREAGWTWNGDYFDPDIPPRIELHHRFWDSRTEQFEPAGLEDFWDRRVDETLHDFRYTALHLADRLGYACLHLLRHLLRGDARPFHAYEIAWFLQHSADDPEFWFAWRGFHGESLRRLEATIFALCAYWFSCRLQGHAAEGVAELPPVVRDWLAEYGQSPIEGLFTPNKHELWLHMALVESPRQRASILVRRLLPTVLPGPPAPVRNRLKRAIKYAGWIGERLVHHVRTVPPSLAHAAASWTRGAGVDRAFFRFLSAAWLYEIGMFVFVLLYNLHLLDLGYQEDFIGMVTGAQTAGSLAGALPAGMLVRRWGMGRFLCAAFLLAAGIFAIRSVAVGRVPLMISAFGGGMALSAFMVAFAPAVARLTREDSRPLGYSIFFSSGVAMGIAGGMLGGRLPGWLSGAGLPGKQAGLFVACMLMASAALPSISLRLPPAPGGDRRVYPKDAPLLRFLVAVALWSLAMGLFNPFFNTYFAEGLSMGVAQIGTVFSGGQVAQLLAMLAAPWILRRIGLITGIAWMQVAAGFSLALLAMTTVPDQAAIVYGVFMAFQWMSEPGMYSVLMKSLKPSEMGMAAALNMTVIGLAQVVAGPTAGTAIRHFGYPPVLGSAGLLAVLAAFLFWVLLRNTTRSNSAST